MLWWAAVAATICYMTDSIARAKQVGFDFICGIGAGFMLQQSGRPDDSPVFTIGWIVGAFTLAVAHVALIAIVVASFVWAIT